MTDSKKTFFPQSARVVITTVLVASCLLAGARLARAITNISAVPSEHWGWNDLVGWINFYETDTVNLQANILDGYASSSAGDFSFDCATSRSGNICGQGDYRVTNDGSGSLSQWAWNDIYGWISFDCGNGGAGCGQSSYRVYVDPATGEFHNYAWNDVIGWIAVNCFDIGGQNYCDNTSNFKVKTSWTVTSTSGYLDSATYDTGVPGGAQLNSVLWHGNQPAQTLVGFQFAASNAPAGPWDFIGPDGTPNTYYQVSEGATQRLDYNLFYNQRYFRYRAILTSDPSRTASPRIDDVIINWSP